MRSPLLVVNMESFNDWDLQAVVRSCRFAHAEDPAGAVGGARHAVAAPPREADPEAPAVAPQDVAVQERRATAHAAPVPNRAAAVAKQEASRMYGPEYLDLDHKPLLLPSRTTAVAARAAGDDVREVMMSFPAASTSGVQSRAVPPGRNKAGARTPRPKRRYAVRYLNVSRALLPVMVPVLSIASRGCRPKFMRTVLFNITSCVWRGDDIC
jgi:WRKY transcription factor 22